MTSAISELRERPGFVSLYGLDGDQVGRWERLLSKFNANFEAVAPRFFTSPGRTELGGNHTDHNNGLVLAAAVDLDSIAVASPNDSGLVTLFADGFPESWVVDLSNLDPDAGESGTTAGLIRGIASRLTELRFEIGGFDAFITSDVLVGSGLSSSASIEILIGTIFNALYNGSTIDAVTIAKAGQFAENNFFGKPCGLMDQLVCAVGGAVMVDFFNPDYPVVTPVNADFAADLELLVVNTGGSHADLTEEYAMIPREMRAVAEALGKRSAREVDPDEFKANIPRLRGLTGDRAVLRTVHFLHENDRVRRQASAMGKQDVGEFLRLVRESGRSSCKLLQNCYSPATPRDQGIMLGLTLTENFLREIEADGACRVHGGGFAGTIQVWLPKAFITEYSDLMTNTFGNGSVLTLKMRESGALEV